VFWSTCYSDVMHMEWHVVTWLSDPISLHCAASSHFQWGPHDQPAVAHWLAGRPVSRRKWKTWLAVNWSSDWPVGYADCVAESKFATGEWVERSAWSIEIVSELGLAEGHDGPDWSIGRPGSNSNNLKSLATLSRRLRFLWVWISPAGFGGPFPKHRLEVVIVNDG
jgi:hypothetical protein